MVPRRLGAHSTILATALSFALTLGMVTTGVVPASADSPAPASTAPAGLTIGQLAAPVDLENLTSPLLGWQLTAGRQTAYQVQVSSSAGAVTAADVWDSGKVMSDKNANVAYAGPALAGSSGYYWRVRTWDAAGTASAWSAISHFGTGPGNAWAGASPIWTPGIASGWADYTYEGTFNIAGVAASVNFRAKDSTNFYMWQFRASDAPADPSTLKIHANVNGSYTALITNQLPFALLKNTNYDYRIVVDGTNVSAYLKPSTSTDWTFVNSTDDASFTAGGIGFRTGSTESAYYDNLKVTDPTGKVLYSNDFTDSTTTDFTCGSVSGGRLFIGTSKNCNYGVDWQNYTTSVNLNITANTAAVSLKGATTNSFYLWQLKVGAPGTIVINKNVNGTYTALKTITLGKAIATGTTYNLKVVALGNVYKTYLDDTLVDTTTDATFSVGRIGFRTGGSEAFTASNLTVTTPDGTLFYSNNFATGNTDFSCGTVSNGTLLVPNNANCIVTSPTTNWTFLRGEVTLPADKTVAWAHLYAAGASTAGARAFVYKMWINGSFAGVGPTRPIGSETRYDGYDVTTLVNNGQTNAIGVLANTTSDQRFIGDLVIKYTDGTTQTFGTGSGWKALNGSATLPDAGSIGTSYYSAPKENFNANSYPFGFDTAGFNDSTWRSAAVKPAFSSLVATPTAKVQRQLRAPASVVEYSPGNYFIDYGRTWVGGVSLNLNSPSSQTIDIRYGEVISTANTVKYATNGGNNYQDLWTLKPGKNKLETWGMRVFRYVQILGAPTGLTTADFPAMAYVYPYDASAGVFNSSDADLNKVWALNKNTIESTNGNLYVDSWERERGAYEADSYLQMMSNFYTSADPTLGNYSIAYLFKQRTWPTEWPIYIILAMHDSYAQTGDIDALNTYYTALQGKLPDRWYEASTGLIRKTSGSTGAGSCTDCDIVDWPSSERDGYVFSQYNTVINAISYRAYSDMVDIATALGKTNDAATYQAKADTIKAKSNELLWDDAKGAYRDGLSSLQVPSTHYSVHASIFATAFGLTDDAKAARVADFIKARGLAVSTDGKPAILCSVYCSAFLFEALYNGDRGDIAYDMLTSTDRRSYLNMIKLGAGATAEAWDPSLKSNLTYSHPWAASVAYNIPQGMFGIKPTTPGYGTFDIKPQPDSVTWANVTVPTLKGKIGAAYSTVAGRTDVGTYVPANTTARVYVPGGAAGATSVFMDGRSVAATYDNGYLRVDTVTPGCHVLSTAAGTAAGNNTHLTSVCPTGYVAAADTTAPVIAATIAPAAANGWAGTGAALAVTATDDFGVIKTLEYQIGDGTWTAYTAPVTLADGSYPVNLRATDATGNTTNQPVAVKVDGTSPVTTLTADTADNTEGSATVTLTATDNASGVESTSYQVDGGSWTTYTTPFQVSGAGAHTVAFKSVDVAGNTETSKSSTMTLDSGDATAPVVTATLNPATPTGLAGWYTGAVKLTLTATDDKSGVATVEYQLGDGAWTAYTTPVDVPEGDSTYGFRATDKRGNTSVVDTIAVQRDVTAPATDAAFDDRNGTTEAPVAVTLSATDATAGVDTISYSVDGGSWTTYTNPVTVSGAGTHTVAYEAIDTAGNLAAVKTLTVVIQAPDTTAPTVTAATNPASPTGVGGWFTGPVSLTLTANDDRSGVTSVEYRVGDDGPWTPYTAPVVAPEGVTSYGYRATDGKGNTSAVKTFTISQDVTAPVAAAAFDDDNGASTGPIAVTLTAADAGSGVATIVYSLDGGDWTTYTNPVSVSGAGTHTLAYLASDKAGNDAAAQTATIRLSAPDTVAPVVTATTNPAAPTGTNNWFTGAVSVTLTATDDRSGVASIEYRLNGGAWAGYTAPVTVPEGTIDVEYRATDNKGNVSVPATITVNRDTTAPTSAASYDDQGGQAVGPVQIALTANDAGSGVAAITYSVNGGAQQTYTAPFEVSGTGATIAYSATDAAGNVEATNTAVVSLQLPDTTAPVITATTHPGVATGANGWYSSAASLTLTAVDDRSGVDSIEYRIGNGPWTAYTTALDAPIGATVYSYRATDGKGNVSAVASTTLKRDEQAPTSTSSVAATSTTVSTVTLTGSDAASGIGSISYRVDAGAWKTYTARFTVTGTGMHTLDFAATDVAGNSEPVKNTQLLVGPDKTAPVLTVTTNPTAPNGSLGWYTAAPTLTAAATDYSGVAKIEYRIGAGAWTTYTTAITAPAGTTAYGFRATDTKGNVSTTTSTTVRVDNTVPTTTATFNDANGTSTAPVAVKLTAADTLSGVAATTYQLDGGAWTTYASPVSVTGAGTHTLAFTTSDKAGNVEAVKTVSVRIAAEDTTAPTVSVATNPAAPNGLNSWFRGSVSVAATAIDPTVAGAATTGVGTIQYQIGTGAWTTYSTALAAPVGTTTYNFRATDKKGNVSTVSTITVQRDITAPTTAAAFNDNGGKATGTVPVTLTATDTPSGVGAIFYSLDQGDWTIYTTPIQVTGVGSHTLYYSAVDNAGNVTPAKTATITIAATDVTAPVVTAATSPASPTGTNSWFKGTAAVTLLLTATDDLSGVKTREYRINGGAWTTYTTAVTVPQGTTTFDYRATDNKGNVSDVKTITVKRDSTVPSTSAAFTSQAGTVPVTLNATDSNSGVAVISYSVDKGAWKTYTGPIQITGKGIHTIDYTATDNAGNTSTAKTATPAVR